MELKEISGIIIDSSIQVHSALGPGLLENAYEACLKHELISRGLQVRSQVTLPITYFEVTINAGYRLDLLVENSIIVELKTVDKILPIHEAQLLSYLKLSDKRIGLLINFNLMQLRHGVKRLVNKL
jgi:GxxExxY protein